MTVVPLGEVLPGALPRPATGGPVLPEPVPGTPTTDRSNRLWQVIEEVS